MYLFPFSMPYIPSIISRTWDWHCPLLFAQTRV
jgi:hypothetical protein